MKDILVWTLCGLAVVVAAAMFLRARTYRRLFSDEHFIEIARCGADLKAAALKGPMAGQNDGVQGPSDPRMIVTSARLAIVYTVHRNGVEFIHHCSVGISGDITAHVVGTTFVAFVMNLIALPIQRARFHVGESTIHHAEATLSSAEHEELAGVSVPAISAANVAEFRRAALVARDAMTWTRLAAHAPQGTRSADS